MSAPWLSVVGIGEDGVPGLGAAARAALDGAELLIGGTRHLAMLAPDGRERRAWPSPFDAMLGLLEAARPRPVCVLASGDPMWFGVGSLIAGHFEAAELQVFPAPSCLSLACARLGWALQDVAVVSMHGRPLAALNAALYPGARVLVIGHDGSSAAQVSDLLTASGFGASAVWILAQLGGPQECVRGGAAAEFAGHTHAPLSVIAIDCVVDPDVTPLARCPGLADAAFSHDGQLTKRVVRAATVSSLAPLPGQCLWDVGAGCGSIAIEWLRAAGRGQAFAIEREAARVGFIRANAARLGTPTLQVVEGHAPGALAPLPPPDAVFIGGGVAAPDLFERCWQALAAGGRLVANAVTVESEAVLAHQHLALGGELLRISVASSGRTGRFATLQPALPVTQLVLSKP